MQTSGVRYLLMGGQACVSYGAAEFSRDTCHEREADREYWRPLRAELERLRQASRDSRSDETPRQL
jgi:hypothetical protein